MCIVCPTKTQRHRVSLSNPMSLSILLYALVGAPFSLWYHTYAFSVAKLYKVSQILRANVIFFLTR